MPIILGVFIKQFTGFIRPFNNSGLQSPYQKAYLSAGMLVWTATFFSHFSDYTVTASTNYPI